MTKTEKNEVIEVLKEKFGQYNNFYVTDTESLTVEQVSNLRRACFNQGVEMKVAKNTLIRKALESEPESKGFAALFEALHGPTTIMISDNPKAPAKIIEEFRKTNERPLLKAAYIDTSVYLGDEQLKTLTELKSKEEMVGEIIGLLQSPARTLASQLKASGSKMAGILKTLEERGQ